MCACVSVAEQRQQQDGKQASKQGLLSRRVGSCASVCVGLTQKKKKRNKRVDKQKKAGFFFFFVSPSPTDPRRDEPASLNSLSELHCSGPPSISLWIVFGSSVSVNLKKTKRE
jgi:hypothetical protein